MKNMPRSRSKMRCFMRQCLEISFSFCDLGFIFCFLHQLDNYKLTQQQLDILKDIGEVPPRMIDRDTALKNINICLDFSDNFLRGTLPDYKGVSIFPSFFVVSHTSLPRSPDHMYSHSDRSRAPIFSAFCENLTRLWAET